MRECCGCSSIKYKFLLVYQSISVWVNRWRGVLSPFLKVLVGGYILFHLVRLFPQYATMLRSLQLSTVAVGILLMVFAVGGLGWIWIGLVRLLGVNLPGAKGFYIYTAANLARYLPGGIWHFAGRLAMLREVDGSVSTNIWSLGIEQAAVLLSAFLVGGLALLSGLPDFIMIEPLLVFIVLGFTGSMLFVGRSFALGGHVVWKWVILFLSYLMFWILYGSVASVFWASLVGWQTIDLQGYLHLIGHTSLSWAAGYLVFFIPGGWGVREVVYARLLGSSVSQDIAYFLPVLMRFSQIISEILCFGVATSWNSLRKRRVSG